MKSGSLALFALIVVLWACSNSATDEDKNRVEREAQAATEAQMALIEDVLNSGFSVYRPMVAIRSEDHQRAYYVVAWTKHAETGNVQEAAWLLSGEAEQPQMILSVNPAAERATGTPMADETSAGSGADWVYLVDVLRQQVVKPE